MRKLLAVAVLLGLLYTAVPAQASTGWARYDSDTWVRWHSKVQAPQVVGDAVSHRYKYDLTRFLRAKDRAIGRARRDHKDWLAERVVVVSHSAPQGYPWSDHWGTGAVQSMVRSLFTSIAGASQVPTAMCVADRESGFNPYAQNPHSSAAGVFQWIASSWRSYSARYGFGGSSVFNAYANIAVAAHAVADGGWGPWGGGCW